MQVKFQLKSLVIAVSLVGMSSSLHAAGLERSGQDTTAFFQQGLYAEASYSYVDAKVSGHDNAILGVGDNSDAALAAYTQGNATGDTAEAYNSFRFGVKANVTDRISVGVLYDQPWGGDIRYSGDNNFVSGDPDQVVQRLTGTPLTLAQARATAAANPAAAEQLALPIAIATGVAATQGEGTSLQVSSENITGLVGVNVTPNIQVFGGPAFQRVEGNVKLRGPAYLTSAGYDLNISPDEAVGWVAGAVYSKPEIALRAALTYRSEIKHENTISESLPAVEVLRAFNPAIGTAVDQRTVALGGNTLKVTTPQSVNLDFQTGINPTTLMTAKVRWVPWSDFAIRPPHYQAMLATLVEGEKGQRAFTDYKKDQWSVEVGVGKALSPALAVSGSVGWENEAGSVLGSTGPVNGQYSVGLGARYNLNQNWAISAGGRYIWLGDAKASLPSDKIIGDFSGNTGYGVGIKLSYQDRSQ